MGETVFEAAAREAQEETGLQIKVLGVVDVIDSIQRDENQEIKYHYTLIDVFAEFLGCEAVADDDAAEVCWIGCDEIETLELWNETARVIRLGHEMWAALHAC